MADRGSGQLGDQLVLVEAFERERGDQIRGPARGDQLGECLADDRSRLEPVGAPTGADMEVLDLRAAEDRAVVGAQVAEARPGPKEPRPLELGKELESVAGEGLQEVER